MAAEFNRNDQVVSIQYGFFDNYSTEERIRHVEELIDKAAADSIFFPELWNFVGFPFIAWKITRGGF